MNDPGHGADRPAAARRPALTTLDRLGTTIVQRLAAGLRVLQQRLRPLLLRPVYAVYTQRLRADVLSHARPGHVAIIMDGNRRWALRQGYADVGVGHRRGAEKALELIDWCADLGIREVTLWALSLENLARPADEVGTIADVAAEALAAMAEGRRRTRVPIRLRVIGRREPLPDRLRQVVEESSALSHPEGTMQVTVALAYSGRDELVEAAQAAVRELAVEGVPAAELAGRLTADALASHLYTRGSSDPDLIIRTSGEVRLSGFLPWQSVYSEYYFCDAFWPAFREIDFLRAIRTFQQRGRRFGQ
ncbi:MAG TPA: polyprenyl diphosphate synthase [Candidatus Limnocylindrales bacterium]